MKKIGFIIVVLLILLAGGTYFFLNQNKQTPSQSLGEQIYSKATDSSAPAESKLEEKLPDTNPFAVETNPAKKAYPNPFD